jgi:hypothetical protein
MFQIQDLLEDYTAPDGVKVDAFWFGPPPDDNASSIEWTGEWTVTFETFRDMGGAFMVALVLIYVLVVWEFGNFRIPALIMAPIPLTLLGIIPAHWLMFKLGLGGEFTATSMIGWIALAGIIVRNSILLVDFSLHEIQRGIPVAEAVIRSCKTRTRPIMITAWALVAGSSVIFTDPIFQGMAISLASGVMVSTILTLIVIPLGCMSAAKSLCEVAAVGCPPGTNIPMPQEQLKPAAAKSASAKPSFAMRIWTTLITVISMVFYALRGIVLLLMQLFKRKPKPKPGPKPGGSVPKPSPSGGASGGSASAPAGAGSGGSAPAAAGGGAAGSSATPPSTGAATGNQSKPTAKAPPAAVDAPSNDASASLAALPKAEPEPVAEAAVEADAPAKKAQAPAATTEAATPPPVDLKPAKSAGGGKAEGLQKKSSRRGIRLKSSANSAPDIDNTDQF